jgi:hypothetical protein
MREPSANPEAFVAAIPARQRTTVAELRALIRKLVPEAKETVLWGSLSYHRPRVGGRVKGAVCLITPKTEAVHLGFIHGAALADPAGLLQGTRRAKRFIPVRRISEIDRRALADLVRAAGEYVPRAA